MDAPAVATRPFASHSSSSSVSQPSALHEAAFDLPAIDQRRDRIADVFQDVDAQQAIVAGEAIDLHFGDGRAVGEVVERLARAASSASK